MTEKPTPPHSAFTTEEWDQTPVAVQAAFLALIQRVEALEKEVAGLKAQLHRNSHNSSQPPSSDGPAVPKRKRSHSKSGKKAGGQPGHESASHKLAELSEVQAVHEVKPTTCRCCGQTLSGDDPTPHRHQVMEVPPVVLEILEYRLHALKCDRCGATTRAELPRGVPEGAFGPHLEAMVSLLTARYRLSKRDVVALLADFFKIEVSLGVIPAIEKRVSAALATVVEAARQYVQQQPVVQLDETGWREANQKAWLWVAVTTWVTVFLIDNSRGGAVAKEILTETFPGKLVSDRWSGYNWVAVPQRQLCWAHLLRDFQAFVDRGGASATLGRALRLEAEQMFTWWHAVQTGTLERTRFQELMIPLQQRVGQLLRQGVACPLAKTAGVCRDILKREAALWTFVTVSGVPPTNNNAERQIRSGVIWRKICFGTQSQKGSHFAERMLTVIATLKQQQRNALDFLTQAIAAANHGRSAPSLIPATTP